MKNWRTEGRIIAEQMPNICLVGGLQEYCDLTYVVAATTKNSYIKKFVTNDHTPFPFKYKKRVNFNLGKVIIWDTNLPYP